MTGVVRGMQKRDLLYAMGSSLLASVLQVLVILFVVQTVFPGVPVEAVATIIILYTVLTPVREYLAPSIKLEVKKDE